MKLLILFLLITTTGFFCTEPRNPKNQQLEGINSKVPITDNYLKLLWGQSEIFDSSNTLELSIHNLNNSMYKNALMTLKSHYTLDTVINGGFYGFTIESKNVSEYEKYLMFRMNEYSENLSKNELMIQLINSVVDSTIELFNLQNIESEYLENKSEKNNDVSKKMVSELKKISLRYPKSKRLQFLLANEYLSINNTEDALNIFDSLIEENYYALISLRTITQYLSVSKSNLLRKYILIMEKKFPDECKMQRIKLLFPTVPEDSIIKLCQQCIKSDFQKDSIFSKLYMARFYLSKRDYSKVDKLTADFIDNYDVFVFDSTLLFERGVYSDIKMRNLYLQGRYNEICKFIMTELGYNLLIIIENNEDLKSYIRQLYGEYTSPNLDNFDKFFKEKFNCF